MLWILFALGAALSWGLYGPALHRGQVELGNPMRALLCVGVAYFLIGVLVPVITLSSQGQLSGFSMKGSVGATVAGALGAAGAVCIILAADVRHAAGIRRCATRQRALFDVAPSTEDLAESTVVSRFCTRSGRWGIGTLFQTTVIGDCRFPIANCRFF
jgi:hypothetical protein